MTAKIRVENAERVAGDDAYPFWVARVVDGVAWFWGAYSSKEKAENARKQLASYGDNAIVVEA